MSNFTFHAAADSYSPARDYLGGTLQTGQGAEGKTTVLEWSTGHEPKAAHKAIYLLDDGASVQAFYVAGWFPEGHKEAGKMFLQPFPVSGGIRPDNGQPVDMSGWMLGPSKAFHLKVQAA